MNISASNIGWKKEDDEHVYEWMAEQGIKGLEIAPTRIFTEKPYEHIEEAAKWAESIKQKYGLTVSSMQSVWYGRNENLFASEEQREILLNYTKKAIDFAHAIGCENLVFGCPRNRNMPPDADEGSAVPFFKELGDYAYANDTVLAMEANPPVYNTNFCNTTADAIRFVNKVNSKGFLLNLDIGTMISNDEQIDLLRNTENIGSLINHVHISEPGLERIRERSIHNELFSFLFETGYKRFVSLEVKTQDSAQSIFDMLGYILKMA